MSLGANFQLFYITRSNEDSFARGVTSEVSYIQGKTRRLVSLEICFMGWLYESLGVISVALTPFFHNLGVHNLHYPDVILMFVAIPFIHMMNAEDTKTIIAERNWYQGIRYIFGIYTEEAPVVPECVPQAEQTHNPNVQRLPYRRPEPISAQVSQCG